MVRMVNSPFHLCKQDVNLSNVNTNTKYNFATHCLAGSLVKTLFSEEIFVTSVGDLKSPTVQMLFLENILPSASKYLLIKDTFTGKIIIYSLLVELYVQIIICHPSKLSFERHQSRPNMQSMRINPLLRSLIITSMRLLWSCSVPLLVCIESQIKFIETSFHCLLLFF